MTSLTRLHLFSRAYIEKIGEPGDEARSSQNVNLIFAVVNPISLNFANLLNAN